MPEGRLFPVAKDHEGRAWIDAKKYHSMYEHSVRDPQGFWGQHGARIDWIRKTAVYAPIAKKAGVPKFT